MRILLDPEKPPASSEPVPAGLYACTPGIEAPWYRLRPVDYRADLVYVQGILKSVGAPASLISELSKPDPDLEILSQASKPAFGSPTSTVWCRGLMELADGRLIILGD